MQPIARQLLAGLAACCLGGCAAPTAATAPTPTPLAVASIAPPELDEISGIAMSRRHPGVLWAVNDDGPAVLHALSTAGKTLGTVRIEGAVNRDWEDLALASIGGRDYLFVADIGDNDARHGGGTIYVIEEPAPTQASARPARRIDFSYPGGSRDAESLAVDSEQGRALVLSKRDIPARLYAVSLDAAAEHPQAAVELGLLESLPQPTAADIERAPLALDWHWQPTAMAFSVDGRQAAVLTYRAVYHYRRRPGESWPDALARKPAGFPLAPFDEAESLSFDPDGKALWITTEGRHAPLLRIEFGGNTPQ